MKLKEYLETLDKKDCPCKCKFKDKNLPIIKIPAPERPRIILISRDPTTDFLPIYEYSKRYNEKRRREMLFTAAIPHLLIVQITKFLRRGNEDLGEKKEKLFKLYDLTYWTHLQKCPTQSCVKNGFELACAKTCANKWLEKELSLVREANDIEVVIALGNHVQRWINKWKKDNNISISIIRFPHPSNQNNRYWCRKEGYEKKIDEMKEEIDNLLELI